MDFLTKLNNILLIFLFHSSFRKELGNKAVFRFLIDDLKILEEKGIEFEINGVKQTIYFTMCLFLGDNLGVHEVLGFVEGFVVDYPCRKCKMSKKNIQKSTELDPL